MTSNFTDKDRENIAWKQYSDYKEGQSVNIPDKGSSGYVSKVVNNKDTGEQSYIITDIKLPENPTPAQLASAAFSKIQGKVNKIE